MGAAVHCGFTLTDSVDGQQLAQLATRKPQSLGHFPCGIDGRQCEAVLAIFAQQHCLQLGGEAVAQGGGGALGSLREVVEGEAGVGCMGAAQHIPERHVFGCQRGLDRFPGSVVGHVGVIQPLGYHRLQRLLGRQGLFGTAL